MKVFVAGATGAIGRPLIAALLRAGHGVTGMARSTQSADRIRAMGADAVEVNALDPHAVWTALNHARPDTVIDELTSLSGDLADLGRAIEIDAHLRVEGGGNLFAAARDLGVARYIQQSSGYYLKSSNRLADESAELRIDAPGGIGISAKSFAIAEQRVTRSGSMAGIALRYGFFYGPGTWYWNDGAMAELARGGELPVIGNGAAVWSFVHLEDAAAATVSALTAEPGIYNIVDDEPEPVSKWLPAFAHWVGAQEPTRLNTSDASSDDVYAHTQLTGASNEKAKKHLAFRPRPLLWNAK